MLDAGNMKIIKTFSLPSRNLRPSGGGIKAHVLLRPGLSRVFGFKGMKTNGNDPMFTKFIRPAV